MPTIPRVTREVAPAPLPGGEFRPEMSEEAAGIGRAAAARDAAVIDMSENARVRADSLAVAKADRFLAERAAELEGRAREARGLDALAAAERALADFDSDFVSVQRQLSGSDQEIAVGDAAAGRRLALSRSLDVHVAGERERYDNDTTRALLEADALEIRRNYLDGGIVELKIKHAKDTFQAFGERRGMAEEAIGLELEKIESGARADVVRSFIANEQPEQGRAYLTLHRDKIFPREREALDALLKDAVNRNEASGIADRLVKKAIDNASARIPDEVVIEGMFDQPVGVPLETTRIVREPQVWDVQGDLQDPEVVPPEIREDVRALVASRLADFSRAQAATRDARYKRAFEVVRQSGGRVEAVDSLTWAQLGVDEKESLRKYAAELKKPVPIQTNIILYDSLMRLASDPDPSDFLKVRVEQMADRLSDSDLRKFVDMQAKIREGNQALKKELDDYRSVTTVVNDAMLGSGAFSARDEKGKAEFRAAVAAELRRLGLTEKPDIERTVHRMLGEVIVVKGWMDTERRYWRLAPTEDIVDVDYDEIHPAERMEIERLLSAGGRVPTEEEVEAEYVTRLKMMRGGG